MVNLIKTDLNEAVRTVTEFFVRNSNNKPGHEVASSHLNNIFLGVEIVKEDKIWEKENELGYRLGNVIVDQSYLKQVLNNAALLIYPNASKLVDIATKNIRRIASLRKTELDSDERCARLEFFLNFMQRIIDTRPCHASLILIRDILKKQLAYYKTGHGNDKCDRFTAVMEAIISDFQSERDRKLKLLSRNALPLIMEGGNILLFGNSDTITMALEYAMNECADEVKNVGIFVCECRNKTLYSFDNSYSYCDGIEYAKKIMSAGYRNVSVISEASIGNLMSEPDLINKVCLGANGISLIDGSCVHSLGHLTVAEIASNCNVPVYILADTYKFYHLDPKPFEVKRENCWLGNRRVLLDHLKEEAAFMEYSDSALEGVFGMYNRREDVVPCDLISAYITDKGVVSSLQIKRFINELKKENDVIVGRQG